MVTIVEEGKQYQYDPKMIINHIYKCDDKDKNNNRSGYYIMCMGNGLPSENYMVNLNTGCMLHARDFIKKNIEDVTYKIAFDIHIVRGFENESTFEEVEDEIFLPSGETFIYKDKIYMVATKEQKFTKDEKYEPYKVNLERGFISSLDTGDIANFRKCIVTMTIKK